jgi:hypothetical protein
VLGAARVLVLVAALCLMAIGLLSGVMGIVASFLVPGGDQLALVTFSVSFLALAGGLGSALAWQAWRSIQGKPSRLFRPQRVWLLGLLFVLIVLIGRLVLSRDLLPLLAFPPLHVAAAALPPLFVVALVGCSLGGVTRWRDVVLQLSSGAFLSTSLAFTLEFIVIGGLLTVALIFVASQPGGLERIQDLMTQLQDPAWLQDPANLAPLVRSPLILAFALLVFVAVVPAIEEAVKTVGVGLMSYRRPGLRQTFLWGLAGGAGFALAEGLFNSVGGLDAWAPIISLRVGATLVHCLTGALMGLAWHSALGHRRWLRALGLYFASVSVHSLWNAGAAGLAFVSLGGIDGEAMEANQMASELVSAAFLALIVTLGLVAGLGLAGLTWFVGNRSNAAEPAESQPNHLRSGGSPSTSTPTEKP